MFWLFCLNVLCLSNPRRTLSYICSRASTRSPRSCKGLEDGCWPTRSSLLPTSHRVYPRTTKHCGLIWHSQARHHCGAECTLGEEHGRSLREEETPVRESTHGMWSQRMGLSSDAHRGWLSWLHRSNNNLIPDQAWTNKQGQTEGHTAASNSSGKGIQLDLVEVRKSTTAWLNRPPSSLLPYPHPTPPHPHPSPPSPSLPPPRPSLSPRVHTEHPAALAPPSNITRWLKLLPALECGVPPVAAETT